MNAWHSMSVNETLERLKSDGSRGLMEAEARHRLEVTGPNELSRHPGRSLPVRLLSQLKDPMMVVLLAAAVLSLATGGREEWLDAAIILVIVAGNTALSLSQEGSAEKALAALRELSAPMAVVIREGKARRIPAAELVPGDLVRLEAGDLVPADGRVLEAACCAADESAMTGESVPVDKRSDMLLPEDTPLADRHNMVVGSTVVTAGRCLCVITATGMDSEVGRVAGLLLDQEEGTTPLQRRMGEISGVLSLVCVCVCAVMFGVGLLQGRGLMEMLMTAVSLAVAAIPEGLAAIVTIVLALGVQRMVKRGAIIRKLPAVETLGCAGVICSDKTGTLTQNKMTVTRIWPAPGCSRAEVLTIGALCSDAAADEGGHITGEPTEAALVEAARSEGLNQTDLEAAQPRKGEIPFDSGRKLMSTVHPRLGGGWRVMVKGAPDVLLARCRMSDDRRRAALRENDAMAEQALRVLGMAYRDFERLPGRFTPENLERELTFVGLVGMMDPPRPEVKDAVEQCRRAGIRPVMITGDHKLTAVAIARELGISRQGDLAITGADLDFMSQEALEDEVERFSVYARVSPEHKLRIVKAWRSRGKVVAMSGDGVNDAPALKAAHIGCAMGRTGTEVAKEASDMILTDDNFATIVSAVAEGRGIYANIRKAIHYLLSCNIGELLALFLSTVLGADRMPLAPVQLLWLNLITDSLPALALGMEPVEEGTMERGPRDAGANLFDRAFSFKLIWQGVMVGLLTLGAYWLGETVLAQPWQEGLAGCTMAFATLTLTQLFHAFDARSEYRSLWHIGVFSSPAMNRAFLAGAVMQLSVLCLPLLQKIFHTVTLTAVQWLAVLGLAIAPVVICEAVKWGARRKRAACYVEQGEKIRT